MQGSGMRFPRTWGAGEGRDSGPQLQLNHSSSGDWLGGALIVFTKGQQLELSAACWRILPEASAAFCFFVSQFPRAVALSLSVSGLCTGLPVCSGRCGFIPCTLLAQYQITHSLPTGMPGSPGATFSQAPETESRNEAQRAGWRQPLGALLHQRCAVRWAVCWPGWNRARRAVGTGSWVTCWAQTACPVRWLKMTSTPGQRIRRVTCSLPLNRSFQVL